jgi:hypothetical protein
MLLAVLAVLAGWVLCSVVTAAVCSTVVRGGLAEDRARGYVVDRI